MKSIILLNKSLYISLAGNIVTRSAFSGNGLGDKFSIKTQTKQKHQHNEIYYAQCSESNCQEEYTNETGHRLSEL